MTDQTNKPCKDSCDCQCGVNSDLKPTARDLEETKAYVEAMTWYNDAGIPTPSDVYLAGVMAERKRAKPVVDALEEYGVGAINIPAGSHAEYLENIIAEQRAALARKALAEYKKATEERK